MENMIFGIHKKMKSASRCIQASQQQRNKRKPNVKTLRSPLTAEFWRHCVLNGGTLRRALPLNQSEK